MTRFPKPFAFCFPLILVFWALSYSSMAEDSAAQSTDQLFGEGFILYQRHLSPEALQKFKKAAELGHAEAAYYAGEIIRIGHTFITPESEKWYRMAAERGDVYAMLRLANADVCEFMMDCDIDKDEWFEKAEEQARPKAEAGDTDAMNALYSVYMAQGDVDEALDWLEKAAIKGHSDAQHWLSYLIGKGYRFYWTDAGRTEDAIHWMRESAESGFPKAIKDLARLLRENERLEEARSWVREMGKTDSFGALLEYGTALSLGPESIYKFSNSDREEGFAMLFALIRETGSGQARRAVKYYSEGVPPEVIEAAKARSEELLVDMPILYYDPKFGL